MLYSAWLRTPNGSAAIFRGAESGMAVGLNACNGSGDESGRTQPPRKGVLAGGGIAGMRRALRIGTRGSPLALAQAEAVAAELRRKTPGLRTALVPIRTSGDEKRSGRPRYGGGRASPGPAARGAFVREIERALAAGRVDAAVHSLKDLPVELPPGLEIAAVPAREDARDCLVLRSGARFPIGARIGTGSRRRAIQLRLAWPNVRTLPISGNIGTRLRKIASGVVDGAVLAMAGLIRFGLIRRVLAGKAAGSGGGEGSEGGRGESGGRRAAGIVMGASAIAAGIGRKLRRYGAGGGSPRSGTFRHEGAEFRWFALPFSVMLPAPGQGALAVEIRSDDGWARAAVGKADCREASLAVAAERSALRAIGGGCGLPMGAYGRFIRSGKVRGGPRRMALDGFLMPRRGGPRRARVSGIVADAESAEALGRRLADALRSGGRLFDAGGGRSLLKAR